MQTELSSLNLRLGGSPYEVAWLAENFVVETKNAIATGTFSPYSYSPY
jgi:hypothetical protein